MSNVALIVVLTDTTLRRVQLDSISRQFIKRALQLLTKLTARFELNKHT